jgi:hypothetical protein
MRQGRLEPPKAPPRRHLSLKLGDRQARLQGHDTKRVIPSQILKDYQMYLEYINTHVKYQ